MEIIILGAGCEKCEKVYSTVEKVINQTGIVASLRKEDDIMKIISYDVMATPAVVIDGIVKFKGYLPNEKEIKKALTNNVD